MAYINKQIGWSQESNLLQAILKQLSALQVVIFNATESNVPTNNYKVYRALISQVGTDDPTVVVLENTLGEDLIFTRIEPGLYDVTSTLEQFKIDKTFLYIGPLNDGDYSSISGLTAMRNYNDSTLKIVAQQNFTERISGDGLLSNTPLEILIYN